MVKLISLSFHGQRATVPERYAMYPDLEAAQRRPLRRPEGHPNRLGDHHPRQITGGPGSIVYHPYVAGIGATNLTWLERNFAITVDGDPTRRSSPPAPTTGSTAAGTSTAAANGNHFARAWANDPVVN